VIEKESRRGQLFDLLLVHSRKGLMRRSDVYRRGPFSQGSLNLLLVKKAIQIKCIFSHPVGIAWALHLMCS
jgi:hypothetical protein